MLVFFTSNLTIYFFIYLSLTYLQIGINQLQHNNKRMKLLLLICAFMMNPSSAEVSDYVGTWAYSINTPDGTIEGTMVLSFEDEEYSGKLTAYGQAYDITDVEQEGNELNFKTSAGGYNSVIKGKFVGNVYTAVIHVEGMQIPMTAKREG